MTKKFWETTALRNMTTEQWESLCDGCAQCCLHKLQDVDSGEVFYTNIACQYLNDDCQCQVYSQRLVKVPDCIDLTPESIADFQWLPASCAYRLIIEDRPLAHWHPLMSGDSESVHQAGISIKHRCINESYVHPDAFDEHVINWVEQS